MRSSSRSTIVGFAACLALAASSAHALPLAAIDQPPASARLLSAPAEVPEFDQQDDLLEGLSKLGINAKERSEVNLNKEMMALAGGGSSGRYAELSKKMELISVRNYEFASKGMYSKSDLDTIRKKLDSNGWSHIVRNESDGDINDIAVRPDGDGNLRDMVILNVGPKEINIVHLRGHFKIDDVNGAMGSVLGMGAGTIGMAGAMGHMGGGGLRRDPQPPATPVPPASPTSPR